MATFNVSSMEDIVFNGTSLEKLIFNGVTVWEKMISIPSQALIPQMTSKSAPYGTVSSSGNNSTTMAEYKAFDQNASTQWLSSSSTASTITSRYLQYTFESVSNPIAPPASLRSPYPDYFGYINVTRDNYFDIDKLVFTTAAPSSVSSFKNGYNCTLYFDFYRDATLIKRISQDVTASQIVNRETITCEFDTISQVNSVKFSASTRMRDNSSSTTTYYICCADLQVYGKRSDARMFNGILYKYDAVHGVEYTGGLYRELSWVSGAGLAISPVSGMGINNKSTKSTSSTTFIDKVFTKEELSDKQYLYIDMLHIFWGDNTAKTQYSILALVNGENASDIYYLDPYEAAGTVSDHRMRTTGIYKFKYRIPDNLNSFKIRLYQSSDTSADVPDEYVGDYFKEISFSTT